ncbi:right-handed parallel beta-helix repeat-containing protein [Oceanobacillus kapialis]|uniref:right-handed parallel beta-helix repeat-containing protein n=1 Tax=Oceanobacillus kapialis TaxID=481353 RepID=UPI00384C9586
MKKVTVAMTLIVVTIVIIGISIVSNGSADNDKYIYVATDGSDDQNGTKSEPYRTLNKAASEAKPGAMVYVRGGTYKEKLEVEYSGTKQNPVVFQPYKQEEVVISGKELDNMEGDTALVSINNQDYITIRGFTLEDLTTDLADETVMGILVTGSSSHITLENNHIRQVETHADGGNAHGVAVYGTGPMTDITVSHNTVEDLQLGASEALVLNGNIDGFNVEGNMVRHNDNIGIDLIGYEGISPERDYVRNGSVKNNVIHDISSYGNPAYGEDYSAGGIYVDGGKNITIEENTIYHSDIGIEVASEHAGKYADQIKILHNTVYDNFYTGISIGGYDEERGGTKNSIISKNVLYRNDTVGLGGGQLLMQHDTKDNIIEKNILTAGPSNLFIANYFKTNEGNTLSRNVFHKEKDKAAVWVWKDEAITTFSDFKTASNSDAQTSYINLDYIDPEKGDFRLAESNLIKEIIE